MGVSARCLWMDVMAIMAQVQCGQDVVWHRFYHFEQKSMEKGSRPVTMSVCVLAYATVRCLGEI